MHRQQGSLILRKGGWGGTSGLHRPVKPFLRTKKMRMLRRWARLCPFMSALSADNQTHIPPSPFCSIFLIQFAFNQVVSIYCHHLMSWFRCLPLKGVS